MKFAYADPPYVGLANHYPEKTEVNHGALINYLNTFDIWALSCSSPSLQFLLSLCPSDIRVMIWVKPFCSFKPGVNPAYAYEPVITRGGQKRGKEIETVRDWCAVNMAIKKGMVGIKPDGFSFWLFDVLGLDIQDDFCDIFPGSGAVSNAWERWKKEKSGQKEISLFIDP